MEETQWEEVQAKPAAKEEPNLNGMEINGTAEDRRKETPEEAGNGKIEIQKDTAKYYSRLGMAYFLGTLVIYAVQYRHSAADAVFCTGYYSQSKLEAGS